MKTTMQNTKKTSPIRSLKICSVCNTPGCLEFRGPNFHAGNAFGALNCDYSGKPPFANAAWKDDPTMCKWCGGSGHPYADESYGHCLCPGLKKRDTMHFHRGLDRNIIVTIVKTDFSISSVSLEAREVEVADVLEAQLRALGEVADEMGTPSAAAWLAMPSGKKLRVIVQANQDGVESNHCRE